MADTNMEDIWYSLYKGGVGEIEEKKSRFIATICPVSTPEEAADFIAKTKKQYWDARHNCSAYVIGDDGSKTRCSDDGEPSGTAGRPMLEVLTGEHITNICVVVTRYFGGTLLGTGGLVRAYQGAVKAGLANCSVLKKIKGVILNTVCEYNDFGKLQFICTSKNYYMSSVDYGEKVTMNLIVEEANADAIIAEFMDATSARAQTEISEKVTYAIIDGVPTIM